MNINIKATNIELTDAIREYVEKRLEGLDKLLSNEQEEVVVQVEVGKTTNHHKSGDIFMAEANVRGDGKYLRASAETADLYASIDKVRDQVFGEAKRIKSKERSFIRKGGQQVKMFIKKFFK